MQPAGRNSTTRERGRRAAMGPRRAVAAGVNDLRAGALLTALVAGGASARAQTQGPSTPLAPRDVDVLGANDDGLHVESVMTRMTSFDQYGHGYQSQAGPTMGPGS